MERPKKKLQQNQDKAQIILNAINDAVFLHPLLESGFAPFEEINTTACKRYGYTNNEFLTLKAADITSQTDLNLKAIEAQRKKLLKNKKMIFETKHVTKSGKIFTVEINSTIINLNNRPMILTVARDITKRKKAEESLHNNEKTYETLFNGMIETVWLIDFNGDLIDVNNNAVNVLGYSKKEIFKIGLYGIDNSLKKENIKSLARSMPADKIQIFETNHTTKDGRTFPVEVYSSLVTYQGEKAILSIARDITKRKWAENEIKRQLAEKESLLKAVHHRIKNNIASVESLLSLQVSSTTNPEVVTIIQGAIGKIECMRILYDTLLLTQDYTDISVKKYCQSIISSIFKLFPKSSDITVNSEIDDFTINQKLLFPPGSYF